MSTGIVEQFTRSFGFIKDDESGDGVFAHWTEILTQQPNGYKTLFSGQCCAYTIEDTPKGKKAKDIRILPLKQTIES